MPNLGAIAEAIAARYASPNLPATPAGADAIRSASANLPNHLPARPCVLVFPDSGTFDVATGARTSVQDWLVRLYYDELAAGDLERDSDELRDWATLLVDQHRANVQLGGLVDWCACVGWRIAILPYAGQRYSGIELRVRTERLEAWDATAT